MDIEERISLIKKKPTEEILTEELLRQKLETGEKLKHYIGFEISGRVHLGTGLMTAMKIKDFQKAGIETNILFADYHSMLNNKLGGDLETIRKVALGYFKSAFDSLGLENVNFILASDIYDKDYWEKVLRIAEKTTLKRMLRCISIMGREETEGMDSATIFYPAMQAADIFKLDIDIAHAGMDQRKVHALAIELADRLKYKKPIAIHTHILGSLTGPGRMGEFSKMSKSKPETCIFIHDSEEEIKKKMKDAFCPERQVEDNPVIEMAEYLLFERFPLAIERPEKFGGNVTFNSPEELKQTFSDGKLHPMDAKNAVAQELIKMLAPAREFFAKHKELLEMVP